MKFEKQASRFLDQSKLKITFTDKIISSYGGFSYLAKLFEKLSLKENIENIFPVTEVSPNSKGVFSKILKFGLTVLAGGKRFAHTLYIGDSLELYQELFNVEKMVKSSTAIIRLFEKIDNLKIAEKFSDALFDYIYNHVIPFDDIKEDYLNFDSTVITRYGEQEGAEPGYNPKKKGRPSHHPIMAFLQNSRYIANLWNRSGKTSSGNNVVDFTKQIITRLNGRLNILGTIADTGFYLIDFIKYLESELIPYVIGAPLSPIIQKQIRSIESSKWKDVSEGISVAEFTFCHKDEKWDKSRRYIAVRREKDKVEKPQGKQLKLFKEDEIVSKYLFSCYITSLGDEAEEIWRKYRLRAGDENMIKENKLDFGLEGFCLDDFYATEAAMLIRILFYNIINFFRNKILPKDEAGSTLSTIRKKYFITPSILGSNGRNKVLRIGIKSKKGRSKFKWIMKNIDNVFNVLPNALHLKNTVLS